MIEFVCRCGEHFSFPDSMGGKMGRCSSCRAVLEVPLAAFTPSAPRAPDAPRRPGVAPVAGSGEAKALRHGNRLDSGRNAIIALAILAGVAIGGFSIHSAYKDSRIHLRPEGHPVARGGGPRAASPGSAVASASPARPAFAPAHVPPRPSPSADTPEPIEPATPKPLTSDQIVARFEPSVAVIRGVDSQGAGFVVAPGLVATNAHVIRRTLAASIRVSFPAGPEGRKGPVPAEVLHFDSDRDLAILAVASPALPIPIAADYDLRRGEDVVYIGGGRPSDRVSQTVASRGMLGSDLRVDALGYYQLSGPVGQGHCGAPVIDSRGRVRRGRGRQGGGRRRHGALHPRVPPGRGGQAPLAA